MGTERGDERMAEDIVLLFTTMGWGAAICLIAGIALVIVEMFTPGFGVAGTLGMILLVIGVVLSVDSLLEALILIALIIAVLGIALTVVLLSASKGMLWRSPLILKNAAVKEEGYTSSEDLEHLMGRRGVAATVLRPVGTGDFDGVRLDVVTEAEFIAKGTPIEIIRVNGSRIVVRPVEEKQAQ